MYLSTASCRNSENELFVLNDFDTLDAWNVRRERSYLCHTAKIVIDAKNFEGCVFASGHQERLSGKVELLDGVDFQWMEWRP